MLQVISQCAYTLYAQMINDPEKAITILSLRRAHCTMPAHTLIFAQSPHKAQSLL